MTGLLPGAAALLLLALLVPLGLAAYRMLTGPGIADRFVALDMLTAVAVGFAGVVVVLTGLAAFLDVALGLVLINFVATCAFASFLERKGDEPEGGEP
ncbi:monovalent cation/H+ antiporter complex subunit F [Roseomonas sp. OT10]|uniref:monovalent cation/H+ antiporter complex subunit F n=1 Tax=Roseomonas cutis TaxID=2897332 RepID=UPI001E4B9F6A|nr:monovalent cation/H+ antiporter complex subunit F [Roseomonas sp. OT10]UFN47921.1 monovalent cation/H+ antiporter complex subunit F [Roseomonas sp. OT10]